MKIKTQETLWSFVYSSKITILKLAFQNKKEKNSQENQNKHDSKIKNSSVVTKNWKSSYLSLILLVIPIHNVVVT